MNDKKENNFGFGSFPLAYDVLKYEKVGFWAIELDPNSHPRMYGDETMLNLMGIPSDSTPEDVYRKWASCIDEQSHQEVQKITTNADTNNHIEIQYPATVNGKTLIIRTGGVRNVNYTKGLRFEGIFRDVTKLTHYEREKELADTVNKDMQIIDGIASEYTVLYHVNLDTGEYVPYHIDNIADSIKPLLSQCKDIVSLFNFFIESPLVQEEYRPALHAFFHSCEQGKEVLRDQKKATIMFKRLYDKEYLWTEIVAIKCEEEHEEAHNMILGFALRDAEVKAQEEIKKRQHEAEEFNNFVENFSNDYDAVYLVDLKNDSVEFRKSATIFSDEEKAFANSCFSTTSRYAVEHLVHKIDKERIMLEIDPKHIRERFKETPTYSVEFLISYKGYTKWIEMIYTSIGDDKFIMGLSDNDQEIVRRRIEDIKYQENFALFICDLDNEIVRIFKNNNSDERIVEGKIYNHREFFETFNDSDDPNVRQFFKYLCDVDYIKKALKNEDKESFTFKSTKLGDKWVDINAYVMTRHEDGTPCLVTMSFTFTDEFFSEKQELQIQLQSDMAMIGGLASEYDALYYLNMNENLFKIYTIDNNRSKEALELLKTLKSAVDIIHLYANSPAVHPDDKAALLCVDYDYLRKNLAHTKKFSIRYRRKPKDKYIWSEFDFIKHEAEDEEPNIILIGNADRDAEIREEQSYKNCFDVLGKEMDPGVAINILLKNLNEFYSSKHAYVFEFNRIDKTLNCTYEYCEEGEPSAKENLQQIPIKELAGWMREFRKHGSFFMNALDDVHNTEEGKKILAMLGVTTCLTAPMMRGDEIIGFIGVGDPEIRVPRLLRTVATITYSEIIKRNEDVESSITLEKLADTFLSVYYADLATDYLKVWKVDKGFENMLGDDLKYSQIVGGYVMFGIAERDRERCMRQIQPEYILEQFKTKDKFSIDMTDILAGYERNVIFNVIKVSDDGTKMVICCTDITDNIQKEKAQQKALQDALDKADDANKAKTSFLFNMSHDIRTPMNAIMGFTNMAIKYINNKPKTLDCLHKTQQSGNMLISLINNVLEVSRIESGHAVVDSQPGDVYYSFINIEETMNELAKAKDIDLKFEFGEIKDRYVCCDFVRCMRIFVNIISNSIKYTPDGGKVRVLCEQVSEPVEGVARYRYIIEDNGIGMSEDYQQHVFEQFSREANTTLSGVEGTGLGMTVVKSFVELLGGTVTFTSTKDVGTTFYVELPFKLQENKEEFTDPRTHEVVDAKEHREEIYTNRDFTGKKVLLVEDNMLNAEITTEILEDEGLVVEHADDGTVAVEYLQDKGPNYYDIVLMDIQMPLMNGYEATKAIRRMYPDSKLPIIALSANAFQEDKAKSLSVGMNDHAAKPIDIKELLNIMAKFL